MEALRFEGSAGEYFKIWIINILLIIVTLGLYYPWAKVRNRRYFYANSTLKGRSFEYHATGKQLFKGYLIAMALVILYGIIQQISPVGSMVVMFLFLLATPWIVWRSMKFNLQMTSFSNVRFRFEGLLGEAYINYMLLPIALFLVGYGLPIGLAVIIPILLLGGTVETFHVILIMIAGIACLGSGFYLFAFMKKRNVSYAVNGYRYGQGQFSINVGTNTFALILIKTIGIGIGLALASLFAVGLFTMVTVGMTQLMEMLGGMNDPEVMMELVMGGGLFKVVGPLYFLVIVVSLSTIAYMQARQRTYVFANSTLDQNNTFASTLRARSLAWVMISNFLVVIFSLGFATPWAKVRSARLLLENTEVSADAGFEQYITAKQEEQSSLGEQIGDAFDVDIELAI